MERLIVVHIFALDLFFSIIRKSMDHQIIIFLSILLISIIAYIREWFPIEVTSLLVLAALLLSGLIDSQQAIQ